MTENFPIWWKPWTYRYKKLKILNHKKHEENYTEIDHNQIV